MSLLTKATPVLVVERIEPVLLFWQKLGFIATTEVPDESGALAFVILAADGIELMYQTAASVQSDLVQSASVPDAFCGEPQQTTLYVQVPSLADVESRLLGELVVLPVRKTFYGATEIGYTDRGGNIVVFAEHT
jgi:hypothetical protein